MVKKKKREERQTLDSKTARSLLKASMPSPTGAEVVLALVMGSGCGGGGGG